MRLYEALLQAFPGIQIGPKGEGMECALDHLGNDVYRIAEWNRPEARPTENDVLAAFDEPAWNAARAAEAADLAVWTAEKQDLRDRVATALTRLQQIQDAAAPTNAQVIAAVRDLAQYLEVVVRALRRMT